MKFLPLYYSPGMLGVKGFLAETFSKDDWGSIPYARYVKLQAEREQIAATLKRRFGPPDLESKVHALVLGAKRFFGPTL